MLSIPGHHPSCQVDGSKGVCVFSLACTYGGGIHLGICRDRFYFASCCKVTDNEIAPDFEAIKSEQSILNEEGKFN